jgi:WD40 repeat protein/serine/threonine protein kinase
MDTPSNNRLEEIFARAAALPVADRAAWLDAACTGQPELRAEVEALLRSHEASGFMEGVPRNPQIESELARLKPEEAGDRIGNYKLREKLGEGGFGVVWVADQESPVRRRVALKIIKLGMDTKEVIARFEQERQALAVMDHPNIAKVLDAGATPFGRPFFVLELVRGIKITDYCDQANLSTPDRLELFIAVCHAVQHAHQKGIIHRDLKPSNILVTLHDGVPVPKVIDFGVAKATQSQRLTDLTIYTQFEQMIGTPLYMSPEQAEMSGLDIDTRSDIYSLGVLLYELLVGRTPFDPEHLMRQGIDEIRRTIREQEPPKPSTALQTMAAELRTKVAQHRQSDSIRIAKLLRGDLDWIVMKALEKDRTRRYETANGFAEDIRRYLSNEPVTAAAPSAAYLLRKFARRHKAPLVFAALIAAVLVTATGISLWQKEIAIVAKKETAEALGKVEEKKAEVDRKNLEYRAMLAEAARSDRFVAAQDLRAGKEREAFAYLARACEYDSLSSLTVAEMAVAALNTWHYLTPKAILKRYDSTMGFSPDGTRIVTASITGKTARVWDGMTGQNLTTLAGHEHVVLSAQFSPDGTRIVTASGDKTARVWDAATGRSLTTLAGHEDTVNSVQFSPDGTRIVTVSSDKTARIWNAATGQNLVTLVGHNGSVLRARFSSDGTRILTASSDWTARVWDAATGTSLATLGGHKDPVWFAQFIADGSRILTASSDRTVRVWDVATGSSLATLAGHEDAVQSAQFSPDGTRIVTASLEKIARVWDVATGSSLATLAGHENAVQSAQFSPDGTRIVTASADKTARVWTVLPPSAGAPPKWFPDFLRYLAQMRLNANGELETLSPDDWFALREKMRAVRRTSTGQDTPYLQILRRFMPE